MAIAFNDFKRQWDDIGPECLKTFEAVASSGWYILGKEVEGFERSLSEVSGVAHGVGLSSGLSALEIALRALAIKPQEKVLTTPMSAFATTLAILNEGAQPIYVDVDKNGNLDLDQAEQVLQEEKIRCMIPVHLYGNPIDLDRLEQIKERYDVLVIEDCAQAIGAKFNNRGVGSVGEFAAMSFYPTKNLGAFGDAGALLSPDSELARRASCLRDYGQSAKYVHEFVGYNARLDEMHAAILNHVLLPKLEWSTKRRCDIAQRYHQAFEGKIGVLSPHPEASPVWHLYPLFLESQAQRDELKEALLKREIGVNIHYPTALHQQPCLEHRSWGQRFELKHAERIAACELSLPIHPYLKDDEVDQVIEATLACLKL